MHLLLVETVKIGAHDYIGQVAVCGESVRDRLYTVRAGIRRLTREDAFLDADAMFNRAKENGFLE